MTALAFYAALKFWLPMLTAFTFIYKGFKAAGKGLTLWADKLLNNHLSHIQTNTEDTALVMRQFSEAAIGLLEEIRNDGKAAAVAVKQVQTDLKEAQDKGNDRFHTIAQDITIIKERM
jgi:hypothetical protein